jgi:acetoin utilization protein AcuC
MEAAFIYSPAFGQYFIKENHPWVTKRSDVCLEMCRRYGLLDPPRAAVYEPVEATRQELLVFHTPAYLDLMLKADQGIFEESMLASGLGSTDCPVFKGVYHYNALMCGASLLGADLILDGRADVVFSPSGGMHHAGPDFAAGFCYLNDPVLAIERLKKKGLRILYVDIDAHHGDQVQAAFYEDDQVLFISFHEHPRTLFPFTDGFETQLGRGRGLGYNVNVPLTAGTGDDVFLWAFREIYPPLAAWFKADVVVGVFGTDMLFSDPNTNMMLTNNGLTEAVRIISAGAPRLLSFGCGGYEMDGAGRAWTLAWSAMTGQKPDEDALLTLGGQFLLGGDGALRDAPRTMAEPTLVETRAEAEGVVAYLKRHLSHQGFSDDQPAYR